MKFSQVFLALAASILGASACSEETQFTQGSPSAPYSDTTTDKGQMETQDESKSADAEVAKSDALSTQQYDGSAPEDAEAPKNDSKGAEHQVGSKSADAEVKGNELPNSDVETESGSSQPNNQGRNGQGGTETDPVTGNPNASSNAIFSSCGDHPDRMIVAKVYQLMPETQVLPDFNSMTAIDEACMSMLNISDRDFSQGFPGVKNMIEWFGLDIRFRLKTPVTGKYTFYINSDDGSILYVNGAKVINNDGLQEQTEKSAQLTLTEGTHDIHIKYFQGPRYRMALELFWKTPGSSSKVYVPRELMSRSE